MCVCVCVCVYICSTQQRMVSIALLFVLEKIVRLVHSSEHVVLLNLTTYFDILHQSFEMTCTRNSARW